MAAPRHQPKVWIAAVLLLSCAVAQAQVPAPVPIPNEVPGQERKPPPIEPTEVSTLNDLFTRLQHCWRAPPPSKANPEDVTVLVTFDRSGKIFGQPKITYESDQATDNDRLLYRIAVMETLQRCTPMPFTDSMGGAVAGRPFALRFVNRKPPPKPVEKRV